MFHTRTPIPLIALWLGAACQPKDSTADRPPVPCGDITCPPGQFCVRQDDACMLIDRPCDAPSTGGTTGNSEDARCWDFEDTYRCEPIPDQCLDLGSDLAECIISYADNNTVCFNPDKFEDWTLECRDYECGYINFDPGYPYCYNLCMYY